MSIPLVRLASLDLIKGFVAVGRRMSVSQAADDLCLSQSAISKQIKALEDLLGLRLLVRGHRSISFTPEGERLFQSANSSMQQLQDVMATLLATRAAKPVTITASIGVAGLWLMPRIGALQQLHPGIDVRVAASNAVMDLKAEGVDLAIRYCHESDAPANAELLFRETIAPVVSPRLKVGDWPSPSSFAGQFLLEFDDRRQWLQWSHWLRSGGLADVKPKGILRYNQYDLVIQAAMAGQGVALGRLELLAPMLKDRRLVALDSPPGIPASTFGYWLIHADNSPRKNVATVADFIRGESQVLTSMSDALETSD